ncbi:S1C family serine protease [Nocardia blacklockiae]|uniref:S1C family serine protease n=1 Tax=Nocardia blacklockiae TaxID=480036 RepID=UPI001894D2B7|nr:trypsin-like peptidase domain-containing protein [Nocardia blacklockiae]MBF6174535.1 trypsin-like peptidase domain-containing protein [Nocardia blacklockiae]
MTLHPNQGNWPGPSQYPYGPPPGGYEPQRPPRRHGVNFTVVAALVLAVAVAIGLVAARFETYHHTTTAPPAQSGDVVQAFDGQSKADLDEAAQNVVSGIVTINTELGLQGGGGAGTGIVLTSDGEVLTNNHVVEGATRIEATSLGNGKTYQASVVGYDRTNDLAVLRLSGASGLPTAPLGDSDKVSVGDEIVGVGNAGGTGRPTAASGKVTALNRSITASDESSGSSEQLTGLIQVQANIQPGDSGGPLVDSSGKVVGVNTAASQGFRLGAGGGQGFAIPINKALSIAEQIQAGTASNTVHIGPTAFLGLTVSDANGAGALVRNIVRGGPADELGLTSGSVITAIDGDRIDSANTLIATMDKHHPGDNVNITWTDGTGRTQTAKAELAEGPVG